jgi:hypothetical protein
MRLERRLVRKQVIEAAIEAILGDLLVAKLQQIAGGFGAGSAPDIVARLIGQSLSERLGQSFVVENRAGASGSIATEAVVRQQRRVTRCESQMISELSGKLGYQLVELRLRPCSASAGSHVPQRPKRKRKFGDVVPIGCIDDEEEIVVARRHIDLFDLNTDFAGELLRRLAALGSILDRADALLGPAKGQYEHRHDVLLWLRKPSAPLRERGPVRDMQWR